MDEPKIVYRITDLAETDRPRERLENLGPQALTNSELLAILIRVGVQGENAVQVGQRLLVTFGGLLGLYQATFQEVCAQNGIGPAKAAQIKAAIELGNRVLSIAPEEKPSISSPEDAANMIMFEMGVLVQENLWVLNLDTRNRLININKLYKGSLNASTIRVAEIFKDAIQRNAAALIVAHNHPSGDPKPSPEDIHMTQAVIEAGKLLDIELLDHLVIGQGCYISMKEKRLGF